MTTILPFGGRIKAASVGLDHLFAPGMEVDQEITRLRNNPIPELSMAFFPRTGHELRRVLRRVGFFRPSLKTDQGMAGNFLPFSINLDLPSTDLNIRSIDYEEGAIIPEAWHAESRETLRSIRASFLALDLRSTYEKIGNVESRRADKGRLPFFFIRPALPSKPIVLGQDVLMRVEQAVKKALASIQVCAPHNLIYFQPDVFILADGRIVVERINCPDVGLFFAEIESEGSTVIPRIRAIVEQMRDAVVQRILKKMGSRITIVTRDEVLADREDILEIREIDALRHALTDYGAHVEIIPVSKVSEVKKGTCLLLLNINYRAEGATTLLRRNDSGEVTCFPNPRFQKECQQRSSLTETLIEPAHPHRSAFLQLASSQPSDAVGVRDVQQRISNYLAKAGIESDILHVALESEVVPVFRHSLHSWRHLAARAKREENSCGTIRIRGIPVQPKELLLTSSTGPRLHAFRFMCVM